MWQASTVPVQDIYLPDTLRTDKTTNHTEAATACVEVLNEGNLTEHCSDLSSSLKDHFLEACIRDYDSLDPQSSTDTMLSVLVFYCQVALDVDECKLSDFLDFCPPMEKEEEIGFMWWILGAIGGLVALIFIICCIICIKKKKDKKKRLVETMVADSDGFTSLPSKGDLSDAGEERETSFMRGRISSVNSFASGRNSVSSIGSNVFESPDMVFGAPPDRFTYRDNKRMLSRATSRSSSITSGASTAIDIMVSPTPVPSQIDNRLVDNVSPTSGFATGRRSSSYPNMIPTPQDKSHLPPDLGTGVSRPRPKPLSVFSESETGAPTPLIPPPPRKSGLQSPNAPGAPWGDHGGMSPTPTPGNLSVKILWNSLLSTRNEATPGPNSPGPVSPGPISPGPTSPGPTSDAEGPFTPPPRSSDA